MRLPVRRVPRAVVAAALLASACILSIPVDDGDRDDHDHDGGSGWYGGKRFTCESHDERYRHCDTPDGDVRLVEQLSSVPCRSGKDWGRDRDGVWVDHGCRAVFEVERLQGGGGGRVVRCESDDGRYRHCRADTDGKARLERQLSSAPCKKGKTWGVDGKGVWVDKGCGGDFEVGD